MNKDKSEQQKEVHVPSKNYACPKHGGSFEKNQGCLVCSPQSQQGIIDNDDIRSFIILYGRRANEQWTCPAAQSCINNLLHQQAKKTRKETLEEVYNTIKKIPPSNATVYGLMIAEYELQSLINNQ